MAEIVSIAEARQQRSMTERQAWQAYLAARERAEKSGRIEDGIAAGKAWARWLRLFERAC